MKILILENDNYLVESKDKPIIGRHYNLEDSLSGTAAQNKCFHALIGEYYKSGLHNYDKVDLVEFKKLIKKNLGAGFESFVYVEFNYKYNEHIIKEATVFMDIPDYIRLNDNMKQMIRGRLKSWSDYSKKQRQKTMDNLIAEMDTVGVCSKKYFEIREGMELKEN